MYAHDPPSHVISDLKMIEIMADGLQRYFTLGTDEQRLVREMVQIATDRHNWLRERAAALRTLKDVLFPTVPVDF